MRRYYAAFFTDALLRRVLTYAIVLYGADVLGRGTWSGLLYTCLVAPYLLSLYAGSLIDTTHRLKVVRLTTAAIAALMVLLALVTHGGTPHGLVVAAIMFAYAVVEAFAYPAFIAGVADLVEPARVSRATIVMNVLSLSCQVAAPVLVGVLRIWLSWPNVFVATIALAAIPLILVRIVHSPARPAATSGRSSTTVALSPWADIAEVHAFSRGHATLPVLLIAVTLFSAMAAGPIDVLVPLFAGKTLGFGPMPAGLFLATGGIGLVVGAFSALKLVGRGRTGAWLCIATLVGSAAMLAVTIAPRATAFVPYFVAGLAAGVFSSLSLAAIQEAATAEMRGRIIGIFSLVLGAPPAIGGAAAGALSDAIGTPAAMRLVFGALAAVYLIVYATRPALRDVDLANPAADGTPAPA